MRFGEEALKHQTFFYKHSIILISHMNLIKKTIFSKESLETTEAVCEFLHDFKGDLNGREQFNG